jgi:hypothetical protein
MVMSAGFDWQFVVVTLVALAAAAIVVRRLMPARKVKARGAEAPPATTSVACAHCSTAEAARKPSARPARTATIPVVSIRDLRESAHQRRQ